MDAGPGGTARIGHPPRSQPGLLFVLIGVIVVAIIASTLFEWMTSSAFRPSPVGPDTPPPSLLLIIRSFEVIASATSLLFFWYVVVRPWRRAGELTWDGMLTIACLSMWIQDPMCNYFNFTFMYNGHFRNMGSWASFLPGWQSPHGSNLPEPLFLTGGVYLWFCTLNVITFSWLLSRLREWWPSASTLAHVPVAFSSLVLLDLTLQLPATRLGLFAYPGAPAALTFWAGEPHQFPIYADLLINGVFLSIGLLRFYRDDRGYSLVERGIDRLRVRRPVRKLGRTLALIGFCNLSYFIVYFLPYAWVAMAADSFPHYPSYMLSGMCGQGTPYACPSREVPVPSRHTRAVVGPEDVRLSAAARRN
jgi:Spirocyclase AveC-like